MKKVGRDNPEYMAVLTEVVSCLFHQLHHPQLTMNAKQITDWFHHVSQEEVQEVLSKLEQEEFRRKGTAEGQSQDLGAVEKP